MLTITTPMYMYQNTSKVLSQTTQKHLLKNLMTSCIYLEHSRR